MGKERLKDFLTREFKEMDRGDNKSISREDRQNNIESIKKGNFKNVVREPDADSKTLTPEWIKENVDKLYELEEFRYTKKINVVELPAYHYDIRNTNKEPLSPEDIPTIDENNKSVAQVRTYAMGSKADFYFGEVVNLYSFTRSVRVYDVEKIEEESSKLGLHVMPESLTGSFMPVREFRFRWNQEELQDQLATTDMGYEQWKNHIFKQIEKQAFDNYEPSFDYGYNFMVRGVMNVMKNEDLKY